MKPGIDLSTTQKPQATAGLRGDDGRLGLQLKRAIAAMLRSRICAGVAVTPSRLGLFVIAALAATLLLSACMPTRPKIEPPHVALERVRILGISEAQASIAITLRLTNPNPFDLAADGVDFEITLDGRPAVSLRSVHIDPLRSGGEAKLDLAGRVDVSALATALMTLGSQTPVDYVLKGSVRLHDGALLPFSAKGEIPVARFERALGARP
jgi:LEA14-like dessication related protein